MFTLHVYPRCRKLYFQFICFFILFFSNSLLVVSLPFIGALCSQRRYETNLPDDLGLVNFSCQLNWEPIPGHLSHTVILSYKVILLVQSYCHTVLQSRTVSTV